MLHDFGVMNGCDGKTVLIVEDDESIRETMQLALEMRGYRAILARNGKEGIEALATGLEPCVVLLDLMMPVMDGWGFVEATGTDPRFARIPIVVLTAFPKDATNIKASQVISKPVPLDVLYATVGAYAAEAH